MEDTLALVKIACTVGGATATVMGIIAKPLWSKLNKVGLSLDQKLDTRLDKLEQGIDAKRNKMEERIDVKLTTIGLTTEGIKARVGEQNGRVGKLETWCKMHEDHDDERHKETVEGRKEVVRALEQLRGRVNQ